jgi:hypothetical protein
MLFWISPVEDKGFCLGFVSDGVRSIYCTQVTVLLHERFNSHHCEHADSCFLIMIAEVDLIACGAEDEGSEVLMVAGLVKVRHIPAAVGSREGGAEGPYGRVILEWESGPLSDCVADSVISVLLQEQGQPAAIGAAEQQRACAPPRIAFTL